MNSGYHSALIVVLSKTIAELVSTLPYSGSSNVHAR